MLSQQENKNTADVQRGGFIPRGDVPSRQLRGGRATADACLNRSCTACACGTKPRLGPPAALPGANRAIAKAVNHHKREVNDLTCGAKSKREPPAGLPGADVWRHAWGDGAFYPCAARDAASDNFFPMDVAD